MADKKHRSGLLRLRDELREQGYPLFRKTPSFTAGI
jgi:hypothetical protein